MLYLDPYYDDNKSDPDPPPQGGDEPESQILSLFAFVRGGHMPPCWPSSLRL